MVVQDGPGALLSWPLGGYSERSKLREREDVTSPLTTREKGDLATSKFEDRSSRPRSRQVSYLLLRVQLALHVPLSRYGSASGGAKGRTRYPCVPSVLRIRGHKAGLGRYLPGDRPFVEHTNHQAEWRPLFYWAHCPCHWCSLHGCQLHRTMENTAVREVGISSFHALYRLSPSATTGRSCPRVISKAVGGKKPNLSWKPYFVKLTLYDPNSLSPIQLCWRIVRLLYLS